MNANDGKPIYKDVSHDSRSWEEVCPDQYWAAEHCMGKEVVLQIGSVQTEQYGDDLPKAVLVFTNDKKWLRLNRENRQVLKEMFGISPSLAIGKWITITAGPNQMKAIVVKILPRITQPPTESVATKASEMTLEEMEAALAARKAAKQQLEAATA